jgi:hypothetical protein
MLSPDTSQAELILRFERVLDALLALHVGRMLEPV